MAVFIIPGFFRKKEFYDFHETELQKTGFDTQIIDLGLNTQSLKDSSKKVLECLKKTSGKDDLIAHSFESINGYLYELQKEKLELELKAMGSRVPKPVVEEYEKRIEY